MSNIKNEVFLGTHDDYTQKLATLAAMTQPEIWSFGKDKDKDPYRILRNYFQFTYNRLSEENKIISSADGVFRCMNTGLLTVYNQEIIAIFRKILNQVLSHGILMVLVRKLTNFLLQNFRQYYL